MSCHYDRSLRMRVTRRHADTCPAWDDATAHCPGRDGCEPCDRRHCVVCGRTHTTPDRPDTCEECETKVAQDLRDLEASYAALGNEALDAGHDGRLAAAAPIPGGDATVLAGPSVRLDLVRIGRTTAQDHRRSDPIPPLAVLAQWEDMYAAWLGHQRPVRANIHHTITYLRDQLPYLAQHATAATCDAAGLPLGPDWVAFTRQLRALRAGLEDVLHDERTEELGVECFECGERLVRRFRPRRRCKHSTPAREHLGLRLALIPVAARLIDDLAEQRRRHQAGDDRLVRPEFAGRLPWPTSAEAAAILPPSPAEIAAAKLPCPDCSQGGIDDPTAGRSWECPGCRKEYDRAEYAYAVRSNVTQGDTGSGSGWWATVQAAADAASDVTGRAISAATIRTWIDRGDHISVACRWSKGMRFGVQMVSWPDVLQRATEQRSRGRRKVAS